jgi:hypothetical protein
MLHPYDIYNSLAGATRDDTLQTLASRYYKIAAVQKANKRSKYVGGLDGYVVSSYRNESYKYLKKYLIGTYNAREKEWLDSIISRIKSALHTPSVDEITLYYNDEIYNICLHKWR